jgi:HEAT repeat protein
MGATVRSAIALAAAAVLGPESAAASPAPAPRASVAACQGEGEPDKSPRRSIDELEDDLRSEFEDRRAAAVHSLAAIGTRPAWELVLGALRDRHPRVADQAEIELAEIAEPKLVELLFGKDGVGCDDAWVACRAAGALGRGTIALDCADLARALGAGDEPIAQIALVRACARAREARRLEGWPAPKLSAAIERLGGSKDALVRAEVVLALPSLGGAEARELVADAARDKDPRVRAAAALSSSCLREVAGPATAAEHAELARLAGDAAWSVRWAALERLRDVADRTAAAALVARLEVEDSPRLRQDLVGALQGMSGLGWREYVDGWKGWVAGLEPGWTGTPRPLAAEVGGAATGGAESGRAGADAGFDPGTSVRLMGLALDSKRLCFLFDFSGSTWLTKVGDKTRKELLDAELRAALEGLPADAWFNVVPYTDRPLPWSEELVPATRQNVAKALAWFEGQTASGKGNYFDAALFALADPDVDTIVACTDGAPTGGHRWNMELMVPLLVEENRLRGVRFDTILVDAPKKLVKHWERLSELTGGRCRVATLQ